MNKKISWFNKIAALSILGFFSAISHGGELEDNLLASSIVRFDVAGIEIAIKKGASLSKPIPHPDAPTVTRTSIQLALSNYLSSEEKDSESKTIRILKILISKGAKLTGHRDELFIPINKGSKTILATLLEQGANPHVRIYGYLPAELAIKYGNEQLLPLLYARGAKTIEKSVAAQINFVQAASRRDFKKMKLAVADGAEVNLTDSAGKYALVQFFSWPLLELEEELEILFWMANELKADPNVQEIGDDGGDQALHKLISMNSFGNQNHEFSAAIVDWLISKGADISGIDRLERTPLHYAAEKGNINIAKILLDKKAKVSPRDWKQRTPLMLAKSRDMIELLIRHGAKE